MKPEPPPIPIAKPCQADWQAMTGDEQRRLCAQCNKHVHNLSAMPPRELDHFVRTRDGTECIAYTLSDDGSMVRASRWPRLQRTARRLRSRVLWLLALILPSLFSACAQRADRSLMTGAVLPGTPPPPPIANTSSPSGMHPTIGKPAPVAPGRERMKEQVLR